MVWIRLRAFGRNFIGVGISQSTRLDQDGKGFGIAGVIVSSFVLFFYVLVIILVAIGISVSI